jgi:5-methylcytosine-specific restriction protein A
MRNPNWTKDELILALELYLREPSAIGNKTHSEIIKLSDILNSLPIHPGTTHQSSFRNPTGVAMKLSNFLRFDPSYTGKGLERGNKLEEVVWNNYAGDLKKLSETKKAIIENIEFIQKNDNSQIDDAIVEAEEGKLLTRVHLTRERSKSIVDKKKKSVLKSTGALKCEACSFDFKDVYGTLGEGFAECHHLKPLSQIMSKEKTRLEDLAILCANCHRMIHRSKPWKSVDEIRRIINN